MNLTKKQKLYVVLLGVGLASLVADRFLIGSEISPDQASADPVQAYAGGMGSLDMSVATVEPIFNALNRGPTINDRVTTLAREQGVKVSQIRDAFVPHPSWMPESESVITDHQSSGLSPEQFRSRYRLMAVVVTDDARYVAIDGKTLRVGEFIHGYRLVAVKERAAVLESSEGIVQLTLPSEKPE